MTYSEEEIKKYLSILQNFKDGLNVYSVREEYIPPKTPLKASSENFGNTHFFKDKDIRYCNKCFYSVGRVFVNEINFRNRCCFKQKSNYKREYHYQNKIDEINENFNLEMSADETSELMLKLQKIDKVIEKINEKWKRKRLINISYLIKRVLSEYDKTRVDIIQLHLCEKILKFYDEWYDSYKKTQ